MWLKTNARESKRKSLRMLINIGKPLVFIQYIVCSTHSLYMLLKTVIGIRKNLFNC